MDATKSDPTPFQKFDALTRVVMSVPKSELDRRAEIDRKQRDARKADKKH
jgi:hypothetical protein